jgi:hypothetical protein
MLDSHTLEEEKLITEEILKRNKYTFDYKKLSLGEIATADIQKDTVPIGTIEFVTKTLQKLYDFKREIPVEIPTYLQTDEFLKREYKIVKWEDLPKTGQWFIKDVSELKSYSQLAWFGFYDIIGELPKDRYYQVSSPFDIEAEYRVYVINNEVANIALYNGNPLLFPDIKIIQKAISLIALHEKWLKSYSLDIMVGKKGTAIIEIHNFTSIGLYTTIWGIDLIYAYRDGIDYLLNDNTVKYM